MSNVYLNYDGVLMSPGLAPTAALAATASGQTLTAAAGVNTSFSSTYAGDTLVGGGGSDTFYISSANTTIIEPIGGGVDTVDAWCGFVLPTNVDNLYLRSNGVTGVANGAGDLIIADGKGDTLVSGAGPDVLVDAGAGGDTFAFAAVSGQDVIYGFQASGANADIIQLSGYGALTFAQVQSDLSQVGTDTLLSLPDGDSILIRNTLVSSLTAGDISLPAAVTVLTNPASGVTHVASSYRTFDNQTLYQANTANASQSTTAAGQTLTGALGHNNALSDGFGGATLVGGNQDDTFYVSSATTKVVEAGAAGIDTINAWCSYTLPVNVEILNIRVANAIGVANNAGDELLASGKGDTLVGGAGEDVMIDGGAGSDIFQLAPGGGRDVIYGFQASGASHDQIQLSGYGFTSFSELQSQLSQDGADTLLALSATDAVLIRNTQVSALTANDFILPAAPPPPVSSPTSVASGYLNFYGQAMQLSAAPNHWLNTTGPGQTLTAGSGSTQFGDQFGGGTTFVGGAGDSISYVGHASTTVVAQAGELNTVLAWCNYTAPANVSVLTIEQAQSTGVANNLGDLLIAAASNVTLVGGTGNDVMVDAGPGDDVFSFAQSGGHDVIYGFQTSGATHDLIQLTNYNTNFTQLQSEMTQVGSDVLISLDANDQILIRNTQVSSLTANDFALNINTSGMTLAFDGEFNTLSLYNPATGQGVWKTDYLSGAQGESGTQTYTSRTLIGNSEQEIYVDPNYAGNSSAALGLNPFSINNGVLTITGAQAPTADIAALAGYQYTSGLITTQESFAETYGYFEMKAALPTGQGVWPAFWLLPVSGAWPPEIDAMEAIGGNTIYQTTHTAGVNNANVQTSFATELSSVSTMHTYGVLWTPTTLNYYVDGVEVASMATPADMDTPMYMLANLALGGNFPGALSSSFTSAQMQIAYIKAYAIPGVTIAYTTPDSVYVVQSATDHAPSTAVNIESAFTYSLAGSTATGLALTGSANINATGNNLGDQISGNGGANVLIGGTGNDTLTAGTGNDTITGGGGTDTFVFNQGATSDVITDFGGHDVIDISSFLNAGYHPTLSQVGANAFITFGTGTSIELLGVQASSLIATGAGYTH